MGWTDFANPPVEGHAERAFGRVRIPTKPAMHSEGKPATDSDLKPAGIPI